MKNIINYILNMIYFIKLFSIIKWLKNQVNSEIILNIITVKKSINAFKEQINNKLKEMNYYS